ncbi:hypothetical protein BC829DRAFT_366650 [Chytridium lagenaria]|nr:hypothetical protein BC829DRAFT_366650 [Chytridium lagenaria]
MESGQASYPASFGRSPRNISKHFDGFKAAEFSNWVTVLSVPLLTGKLPEKYLAAWARFAEILKICHEAQSFTKEMISEIRVRCEEFYLHYEKYYYREEFSRLGACRSVMHYILHIADSIEVLGPLWCYWQYPMERLIGLMGPLIKSRSEPYWNLVNSIVSWMQLNALEFLPGKLFSLALKWIFNKLYINTKL